MFNRMPDGRDRRPKWQGFVTGCPDPCALRHRVLTATRGADTGPVTDDRTTEAPRGARRWAALGLGAAVWVAGSVLAFLNLDPILAAFLVILAGTAVAAAAAARDWDRHSTFEERELARARKRAEKWERTQGARDRDRARWEAHQARQAKKSAP